MPRCRITLTANAGVVIMCGGLKIFCDALHRRKTTDCFSTISPEMQNRMLQDETFSDPDIIFYTHKHPDHYSRTLTQTYKERTPSARIISPVEDFEEQFLLYEDSHKLSFGDAHFLFKHFRHDGKEYVDLPNYVCIMDLNGFKILVLGDCVVANPNLIDWLEGIEIDLALLNFPWLTLGQGRAFISEYIKPQHAMFYHLPFAEDDNYNYRSAAINSLPLLQTPKDARLLFNPFQTEFVD